MIYIGIDDTDMPDTPGTNQLARAIVRHLANDYRCVRIVRHQLCGDPRIPCTCKNGSASIVLEPRRDPDLAALIDRCRTRMREWFVPGSDPGLCVVDAAEPGASVPPPIRSFARKCQLQVVTQDEARSLASAAGLHLEGLGGTEGGVIGALAAVGLAADADDGRIIQWGAWPDDLCGCQPASAVRARDVAVREQATGQDVEEGPVDVGKHLRPNLRAGRAVLFVEQNGSGWKSLKLL